MDPFPLVYQAITQGLIWGFCTAALIGPVNIMAVRRGILGGFQQTVSVGAGAAFVDALCAYLVFAGLIELGYYGAWKIVLWGVGIILILYIAYATLMEIGEDPEMTSSVKVKRQLLFFDHPTVLGFILAASNPFTLIYWIGVVGTLNLSGFIDFTGRAATSFFSAVLVGEMVWFLLLGIGVHHSRNLFNQRWLKRISRAAAVLIIGYGLFMAAKIVSSLVATGTAPVLFGR
jgi:threonine/homoserine/homoserine lactone efflux protein